MINIRIGLDTTHQFEAVHGRHDHIADNQVGPYHLGGLQSLSPVIGFYHVELITEQVTDKIPQVRIVFYHQYGGFFHFMGRFFLKRLYARRPTGLSTIIHQVIHHITLEMRLAKLKRNRETATLLFLTINRDRCVMQIGELLDQRQTQSGRRFEQVAFNHRFEALKDVLQAFSWYSLPLIGHRHGDPVFVLRHRHGNGFAIGGILDGVGQQVKKEFFHLIPVQPKGVQVGRGLNETEGEAVLMGQFFKLFHHLFK